MNILNRRMSGQATAEYALILSFVSILALVMITILANPQNFREGIIYKGIYRPVQCAVQGISPANCQDASGYSAIRYPSVQDGGTRKLCNDGTYLTGDDPWTDCATGGSDDPAAVDPPVIGDIVLINVMEDGQPISLLTDASPPLLQDTYDFTITFAPDSPEATRIRFIVRNNAGEVFTDTNGFTGDRMDNDEEFTLNDRTGIKLDAAGPDGPDHNNPDNWEIYKIIAVPYLDYTDANGDPAEAVGDPVDVTFQVKPRLTVPIRVAGMSFVDPGSGANEQGIQPPPPAPGGREYYEGDYAIKVDVTGEATRLTFDMQGPVDFNVNIAEALPSYYPFGISGVVEGKTLTPGTYTLTARAFDVNDVRQDELVIQFRVIAVPAEFSITSFQLVDANNEQIVVDGMTSGDTYELEEQDVVSFAAVVNNGNPSGMVGSVSVTLSAVDGSLNVTRASDDVPYTVFGYNAGNYEGQTLAPGDYMLMATPYTEASGGGDAGPTKIISFTVERPPEVEGPLVSAFKLVNLSAGRVDVRDLTDGDNISVTYNWNLRTEVVQQENPITFVEYQFTGQAEQYCRENYSPYHACGDDVALNLADGDYTLTVTAHDSEGNETVETLDFTVSPVVVTCDDTNVELVKVTCNLDGYYARMEIRTFCSGNEDASIVAPSEAATNSSGGWGEGGDKRITVFTWNGTNDPSYPGGSLWPVCNGSGSWDPITLEIDFGGLVEQYSIDLTDNVGENLDIPLTPN